MDAFDEMQTAALTTLDRMLDAATDLRATLTQAAQERRKAELVRQSLAELEEIKDSFVAIISHELRTPVGVVSNGVELLQRRLKGRVDAVEQELLHSVQQQSRHLATLVRELTEFNDLSHTNQLSMSEEALRLAVDASIVNLRDVAATRKIELRVSYPPETPQFVGDWQRLRVVLENLLANAVRFTPNGGLVELVIAVEGDQILLRVRDTGAGIPPAQLARIFDSFRQVEEPNTRHYGGLGLGLSIIQRAIASMSGKITVESTLGVGSTFTIVLPLRGTPIPVAPEPNGDLRSSLLRHIQSLQARLDNSERYAAQLATELQQYRPEPVGNA
jgi:signal transduction histidine kinase